MIDREMKTTINNWILQGKEAFLLTGARQIGKTYLIRECLKESKYDYVELNFIERPELVEPVSYTHLTLPTNSRV